MALSVNSSGQVYYQGKHWNIDDPLKPIGLTDLIRERGLKNEGDDDEESTLWKVVGVVSDGIQLATSAVGVAMTATKYIAGASDVASRVSSAVAPTLAQSESSQPSSESSSSGGIFSFLAAAPSASQDPRWAQAEEMRQKGRNLQRQSPNNIDDASESLLSKKRPFESGRHLLEFCRREREASSLYSEANRIENQIAQDKLKESSSCLLM